MKNETLPPATPTKKQWKALVVFLNSLKGLHAAQRFHVVDFGQLDRGAVFDAQIVLIQSMFAPPSAGKERRKKPLEKQ